MVRERIREYLFPRSGRVVKEHLWAFKKRWFRRWGAYPVGVWKLEFQRRGAPHFHLYVGRPAEVPAREFLQEMRNAILIAQRWAQLAPRPEDRIAAE